MCSRIHKILLVALAAVLWASLDCKAQFKEEAFKQNYSDTGDTTPADSVQKIFSLKEYWGGITHKNEMRVNTSFEGSLLLVGGMQIYNRDYWKLPIIYTGIAAGIGGGVYFNNIGNKTASALCYAGAGLCYWGSLMDGTICHKPDDWPNPQKATIYSILVPGLGQIYNREMWKLPLYWGIMIGGGSYYFRFRQNYERFSAIYNSGDTTYIPAETAKYYKNIYRRYRDYALLVVFAGYVLQILDANVFAYMHNFEISDDISMDINPTIVAPENVLAPGNAYAYQPAGVGLSLSFRF